MVRRVLAIVLSLAFVLPLFAMPAQAQQAGRTFSETGQTVQGAFLAFYDANGGEEIFGLPLTAEIEENGRRVQYFTRARFEAWPENPPGHQVQLGLLGTLLGKVQPAIEAEVAPNDPVRRYFPETGHVVAFAFKEFWETKGGLAVFGYPTTEQLVEDGLIVQYFQRARMEWHPENPAGQQVVLSDLGAQYLQQQGRVEPVATPVAPAFDGVGRLVFQTAPGGAIFVARPDGSELRHVGSGVDPSWSADGSQIVYSRWDYPQGIYLANADGTGARRVELTSFPFTLDDAMSPSLSPDGRFVAYDEHYTQLRSVPRFVGGTIMDVPVLFDLWRVGVIDLSNGQVHHIDRDDAARSPSWGPDGRIVYKGEQGLYIVSDVTGKRDEVKVPNTDARFDTPAWSPDGEWIAFQWRQHDHWEIGVIHVSGAGFRLLTSSPPFERPANNVSPAWSPDGKQIAFLSDRTGQWQLYTMNADGTHQQMVDTGNIFFRYDNVKERMVDWGR